MYTTARNLTIVVSDTALQKLATGERSLRGIAYDVDESDAIQLNHLLKVDITGIVAIDVFDRNAIVCPIAI